MEPRHIKHGGVSRWLIRAGTVLFVSAAGFCLWREVESYPLLDAASIIENTQGIPAASEEAEALIASKAAEADGCGTGNARARVSVTLFLLRRAAADRRDLAEREQRFAASDAAIRHGLECDPLDGKLWALAAAVEQVAAYEPRRFAELFKASIDTAPFEGGALEGRWDVAVALPDLSTLLQDAAVRDDLLHAMEVLRPDIANKLIERFLPGGHGGVIAPIAAALPRERIEMLMQWSSATKSNDVQHFLEGLPKAGS